MRFSGKREQPSGDSAFVSLYSSEERHQYFPEHQLAASRQACQFVVLIQINELAVLCVQIVVRQGIFGRPSNPQLLNRLPDGLQADTVNIP